MIDGVFITLGVGKPFRNRDMTEIQATGTSIQTPSAQGVKVNGYGGNELGLCTQEGAVVILGISTTIKLSNPGINGQN